MRKYNIVIPDTKITDVILQLRKNSPEFFIEEIDKIMVSMSFSYSIWANINQPMNIVQNETVEKLINKYEDYNSPLFFSFENTQLENKHLNDCYCNMLLELSADKTSSIIVHSKKLAEYIKQKYPKINIISSAIHKDINPQKPFDICAFNYEYYKENEAAIKDKTKAALYVNSYCKNSYGCIDDRSKNILNYEILPENKCSNCVKTFKESMSNTSFINNDSIKRLAENGTEFFMMRIPEKSNALEIVNPFLYYLIKPEHEKEVCSELIKNMSLMLKNN